MEPITYIVNVSGGLTSYEALRRTVARYGVAAVHPIFADTKIEDSDLYRFLTDQERILGVHIERVADGRDPWQAMKDRRAISIKSAAPCSQELKKAVIERIITERYQPDTYVRVFGMDWSEMDRMTRLTQELSPVHVWFPLADPPYVDKCSIAASLEQAGIEVPFLYRQGFVHNNCGGGCVKAGQAHWAHLWRILPDRYALWEAKEEEIRQHLEKDVTILKDRRGGGPRRPISLREFRQRLERGEAYEKDEWGGCGCFAPNRQLHMDEILLAAATHTYHWKNNTKRALLKDRKCCVLAYGARRSALVEFEGGQREIVDRRALRRIR